MTTPERPDDDASAAEIARWRQEDWEAKIAEGAKDAVQDDHDEDEPESYSSR